MLIDYFFAGMNDDRTAVALEEGREALARCQVEAVLVQGEAADPVVARWSGAKAEDVGAGASIHSVVALAADKGVVANLTAQGIVASTAPQMIVPFAASQQIDPPPVVSRSSPFPALIVKFSVL